MHFFALWQGEADDGAAIEGVGVVLVQGEGCGQGGRIIFEHGGIRIAFDLNIAAEIDPVFAERSFLQDEDLDVAQVALATDEEGVL